MEEKKILDFIDLILDLMRSIEIGTLKKRTKQLAVEVELLTDQVSITLTDLNYRPLMLEIIEEYKKKSNEFISVSEKLLPLIKGDLNTQFEILMYTEKLKSKSASLILDFEKVGL